MTEYSDLGIGAEHEWDLNFDGYADAWNTAFDGLQIYGYEECTKNNRR